MATKQKMAANQAATRRKPGKMKVFLVVLLSLLLVGGLTYAWRVYQSQRRFAYAEQKKNEIVQELVKELGNNVADTRVQNECFEAEQRPYYGGVLWCQTATVVRLNNSVDFNAVGNIFLSAANQSGLATDHSKGTFPSYWAYLSKKRGCQLSYKDTSGNVFGDATTLPFGMKDEPALAVACSDHSTIRLYPYSD